MSRRLRIGVSARIQYGDAAKPGYLKKNLYYLEQSFARWLQSAGVLVYLVPDVVDRASNGLTLADYAQELDGLVLQGGSDISPQTYGERPLRPEWTGEPERDRYELELVKRFLDLKKPILGVCRGQQIINVALGGTLYQDTATQQPGALVHQDPSIYDVNYRDVPNFIPRTDVFSIGGVHYTWNKLAVLIITIPVLALLTWFVQQTRQGKAMRAVAQDPEASAIMGINVNRTISVTFALAGGLAGAAGIVYLLQFNMRYDTGFELGLIAFTAAVLGGIGNLTGAVLGAMVIGFIQAFNEGLVWYAPGSDWTRAIVFGILIAILVFRPEGLLGERTPEGA